MDVAIYAGSTAALLWYKTHAKSKELKEGAAARKICYVSDDNKTILHQESAWYRATYTLVMHEPPHMFYEPKEWSYTSVLLLKHERTGELQLPGGLVYEGETYEQSAVRRLHEDTHINVCLPENCLHHLFTFPFKFEDIDEGARTTATNKGKVEEQKERQGGVWGDFYECVYRGRLDDLEKQNGHFAPFTLAELKDCLDNEVGSNVSFTADTRHALKLYFQRQGDLRAKRRLMKGYSSLDLEHYGLRSEKPLVLLDYNDDHRQEAIDYTMKTDDGMSPRLLHQADLILLGVSRAGKTPLSILIATTTGLKTANIPLVLELDPPKSLTEDKRIDPKKVFCLTVQSEFLRRIRTTRLRRELKKQLGQGRSKYADKAYVEKDLAKAKKLCEDHGFTEIDVTGRAIEETASLIVSKMKERFPDMHIM